MKNKNLQRLGPNNGRWKGGKSKTYYRRVAGCKKNDGNVIHHLSLKERVRLARKIRKGQIKVKRIPNTKDRVIVLKTTKTSSARGKHNKLHPEKGGNHGGSKKRKRVRNKTTRKKKT